MNKLVIENMSIELPFGQTVTFAVDENPCVDMVNVYFDGELTNVVPLVDLEQWIENVVHLWYVNMRDISL